MKRTINILAAVALLFGVSTAAFAQDAKEEFYPNWFIGVQGGVQTTFTNYNSLDLLTPQFGVQVGRWFAPEFGARIHLMGWQQKGGVAAGQFGLADKQTYKFNAGTADMDFLFNMSNILYTQRPSQAWNWILLAGFGANYSWDYDEFKTLVGSTQAYHPYYHEQVCGTKHATFNGRFGTAVEYNFSRCLALDLEVDANYKNDLYNLKTNECLDWQVAALVGLTYKFGMKKKAREVVETYYVDEPYTETVKKQRPVETVEVSNMEKVVYYQINISDVQQGQGIDAAVKEAADLIKTDPEAKILVTGYADVQTGNPEINQRLSKERAEGVANKLVNEHGINAANITVDWKGDTVQPFSENDKNRCVIIRGEGKFKVTKYETYEEKVEKTRQVEKTRTVTK